MSENKKANNNEDEKMDDFSIEGIIQCDLPNPSLCMING